MTRKTFGLVTAMALFAAGSAHATLFDRGGGLIYDSTNDITWLQDWNLGKASGYDVVYDALHAVKVSGDGRMNFGTQAQDRSWLDGAMGWAEKLDFGGYTDWRLPNHTEVSGTELCDKSTWIGGMGNCGLFINMQSGSYWNADPYPAGIGLHYAFQSGTAATGGYTSDDGFYAVAVRKGDVIPAIPEPETWALMLLGLGSVAWVRKRKAQH